MPKFGGVVVQEGYKHYSQAWASGSETVRVKASVIVGQLAGTSSGHQQPLYNPLTQPGLQRQVTLADLNLNLKSGDKYS